MTSNMYHICYETELTQDLDKFKEMAVVCNNHIDRLQWLLVLLYTIIICIIIVIIAIMMMS